MPHESSAAEGLDTAPSSKRRVKQKPDFRAWVQRSRERYAEDLDTRIKEGRMGPEKTEFQKRVDRAASVLGQDRAKDIWDQAITFLTHVGHTPRTKAVEQQATEYVFEAADILEKYTQGELDDTAMRQAISGVNARMDMPENFNPLLLTGKSRPTAMRSLEAGAGRTSLERVAGLPGTERAPHITKGARTRLVQRIPTQTFVHPAEAPEPETAPTNAIEIEIEALKEEEAGIREQIRAIKGQLPLGTRVKHWWKTLVRSPESPEQQWLGDLERKLEALQAKRFWIEEDRQMGTYVKTLGRTAKDFLRSVPIPGMETADEREAREVEVRHGGKLEPSEFTNVREFERSLGEYKRPKLSELMQDSEFRRTHIVLGDSNTRDALAFFQKQRRMEFNARASNPEIVDPGPAWEFLRVLADYVESRRSGNKKDIMRDRTALTKFGERNGIPAHEMLGLTSRLMQREAEQRKARKEEEIDQAAQ